MLNLPRSIQSLAPKAARLCLEIEKYGNLKSGTGFAAGNMLVGVSGGIDSTALLIIATLLARRSGGRVFCAHINHGLRDEAVGDAQFVAEICKHLSIDLFSTEFDVRGFAGENSIGLEEAGRILRYRYFKDCLTQISGGFLLLAHHLDDLGEDLIMRLLRGSGWPSLAGMDAYDPDRRLLRPLLATSKSDLQNFLETIGCPWRNDDSNLSEDYTRNRVRNKIIPLLKEENPNFNNSVARLKNQAELDEDFWQSEINQVTSFLEHRENGDFFLPCSILNKSHPALRLRIYKVILDRLGKGHALSYSLNRLEQAFSDRRYGSTIQFPGKKSVTVNKIGLLFKVIKTIDRESGKV